MTKHKYGPPRRTTKPPLTAKQIQEVLFIYHNSYGWAEPADDFKTGTPYRTGPFLKLLYKAVNRVTKLKN